MSKRLLTFVALIAANIVLSACSSMGPKPHVVYHRPDIKSPSNKVIIMPVTNFKGIKTKGAKDIELSVNTGWSNLYGADKVIPAGPVVEKLNKKMKGDYATLIKALDNVSMVEQLHKNKKIKKYISKVTSKLGNHHLAFAIINGDKKTYDAKKDVVVHLGLFDTENLTWKWITKIQDKKGPIGDWMAASGVLVSNSFDKAKEVDAATENMARKPANN